MSSSTLTQSPRWSLPPKLTARAVLPDRHTPLSMLKELPGKETDPGRMGLFICLMEDRPHLFPTFAALHKHRLHAHTIALPVASIIETESSMDIEEVNRVRKEWISWKLSAEEEMRRKAYLPLA